MSSRSSTISFSQKIAASLSYTSRNANGSTCKTPNLIPRIRSNLFRGSEPRLVQGLFLNDIFNLRIALWITRTLVRLSSPSRTFTPEFVSWVRLGIGLFRLAKGTDYSEISKRFGVSESVARFYLKQLCRVLCTNFRLWVVFPSTSELESVSRGFEALSRLPNCCGIIDCMRFKVVNPETSCEDCITAQIVVDSSCRILSIIAVFHGH